MKTHLILSICLFTFLALTLSNCKKADAPVPVVNPAEVYNPFYNFTNSVPNELDNLTGDFARVSSTVLTSGNTSILQSGHVWSNNDSYPSYDEYNQQLNSQTQLGAIPSNVGFPYKFTSYVKGLQAGTTYTVRPYVKTNEGTFYGPTSTFRTLDKTQN